MAEIKKGTTDVARYVMIVDSTDGSPETGVTVTTLDLQYTRNTTAPATKMDATAGSLTAHSDNTVVEVDATSSPGLYKVDWPDAAFATGVDDVQLVVSGTGFAPAVEEISLVDNVVGDVVDASDRVDVGSWLGTAVTLSSGAPDVNIQSTDDIDLSATQKTSVNTEADTALSDIKLDHLVAVADSDDPVDDSIIAKMVSKAATANWSDFDNTTDSLQAQADDALLFRGTSTASSTTVKVFVQAGDPPTGGADDDYNDLIIVVWDGSDKDTARMNVRVVDDYDDSDPSFTVGTAFGFTPASGDLVEVYRADAGALALLNILASGFSATSPNRLIDHFRAMMSKSATVPGSMGTYSPATDSLEILGECCTAIEGAGFTTSTDSLHAIRDYLEALIAPSIVTSTNTSGSGFISDCIGLVRRAVNEPSTNPKYTNADILEFIEGAMDVIMADLTINTDHPVLARHDITIVAGQQTYHLPRNMAQLWRVAKINSTTGLPEWEIWPSTEFAFHGRGFSIEGHTLRLLIDWRQGETIQILYIPNSEVLMHKATATAATASTVTFPVAGSITDGTLDTRPNAYVGYVLRILSSTENYTEERIITAYDHTTRVATLSEDWSTTPSGTVVYEVIPQYSRLLKHVVCLRASLDILAQEGNKTHMATQTTALTVKMTALRRTLSNKVARFPHSMGGDNVDNEDRHPYFGQGSY